MHPPKWAKNGKCSEAVVQVQDGGQMGYLIDLQVVDKKLRSLPLFTETMKDHLLLPCIYSCNSLAHICAEVIGWRRIR